MTDYWWKNAIIYGVDVERRHGDPASPSMLFGRHDLVSLDPDRSQAFGTPTVKSDFAVVMHLPAVTPNETVGVQPNDPAQGSAKPNLTQSYSK